MKFVSRTVVLLLAIAIAGCSYLPKPSFVQSRDKAYLSAQSIPPLKIPPGISSSAFHNAYPVSDKQSATSTTPVDITPPGLNG